MTKMESDGAVKFKADINAAAAELEAWYVARHPESAGAFARAQASLPGGNTRSVLHYDPFPLTIARGHGAHVYDADGLTYLDCVGEFSAGLYGHSDRLLREAIINAVDRGMVLAGPNGLEALLAEAMRARFPAVEKVRFCNSGTEANLFAILTAMAATGRKRLMVFDGGYHGGVLVFADGRASSINVPFELVMGQYNDVEGAKRLIAEAGDTLAAVLVEPLMGAGGNIPASTAFLAGLREATRESGAVLIFDEVKTSRLGGSGLHGQHGVTPDLVSFGKYLGGGLPCGAFAGSARLMDRFDPKAQGGLKHAGTFNNNSCSMSAGLTGLTRIYTPQRADAFTAWCEAFRSATDDRLAAAGLPMQLSGQGSIFTLHFTRNRLTRPSDIPALGKSMQRLFHLHAMSEGVLVCARGDFFLSLPMTDVDLARIGGVIESFATKYRPLLDRLATLQG
jgi:glutamate-1-semialdehyde 2,1-aminomutase